MTVYNREKYISEAIESVLLSTYSNFELIIVDDNSTDATVNIVKTYAAKDDRIKFYANPKNLGDYPNRNKAAEYAIGEILMSVDSDDKLLPVSMEKCVSLLNRFPEVKFGISNELPDDQPVVMDAETVINSHFFRAPLLMKGPGGIIIYRDFFNSIGGFPEKYGPANDMYFNLKAASQTNVLLIPFDFIFYRRHDGQEINNKHSYLYNNYRYLRDALNELTLPIQRKQLLWLHRKNKRRFVVNLTKFFIKTLDLSKTRQAIQLAGFSIRDFIQGLIH